MTTVSSARLEWEVGHRRFLDQAAEPAIAAELHRQIEVVTDELRRRVGSTFTLAELASTYDGSDRWLLEVIGERAPSRGWVRTASVVGDAAFHRYSRAAQDYEP